MRGRTYDIERTYDRSWKARIRLGHTIENAVVVRFVRQLEYRVTSEDESPDWRAVVRYDHGPSLGEHDATEEGLHMDVYREGEKLRTEQIGPPEHPNRALNRAEEHLALHAKRYIRRFERWHNLDPDPTVENGNSDP